MLFGLTAERGIKVPVIFFYYSRRPADYQIDVAAINAESIGVAGIHGDRAPVPRHHRGIVVETVIGVNPAVKTPPKIAGQPVRVFLISETYMRLLSTIAANLRSGEHRR